jgi:prevent-host-death family protein
MTMVMTMVTTAPKTLSASAFKARCLALMDEVERTGEPVIITKHGRPVAQLTSARPGGLGRPIFGLHQGQLIELDAHSDDQPVVDPSAWTADEANLA